MRFRHKPLKFEKKTLDDNLEGIVELTQFLPEKLELSDILGRLADKKYWIYVAKDPETDKEAGSAIWYEYSPGEIYFWMTAVDPKYSGRKIGSRLLDLSMGISNQQGYSKLSITTFNKCRGMLKLCKKRNFIPQENRKLEKPYGSSHYAIDFEYDFGIDNRKKLSYVVNEDSNGDKSVNSEIREVSNDSCSKKVEDDGIKS